MTIAPVYQREMIQGSDEWIAARCGLLTASEVRLIMTPGGQPANNDTARAHVWEMLAQRISRHVEPSYVGDDMLRGYEEEVLARDLYSAHVAPVVECGFVTRDMGGWTLGCSPDGLVGDDGLIEIKSRRQKFQVKTIVEGEPPAEYVPQMQTALLVTGRAWCDYVSYSGGLPMIVLRVYPDPQMHDAIVNAAVAVEEQIASLRAVYDAAARGPRAFPTERTIRQEIML